MAADDAGVGTNAWDLRMRCFATLPVRKGDWGVAKYWIRSTREDPAISHFVVEQSASPWAKPVDWTATAATREWKQVNVAFRWDSDYTGAAAATQYNLSFGAGLQVQEIEIGGFELRNH
ncbi:MAG: hypothetical protein FJW31_22025, partial [Acidobacteria bacterium]|nr:hypothetical protein [Acidobacteriota bacterium]